MKKTTPAMFTLSLVMAAPLARTGYQQDISQPRTADDYLDMIGRGAVPLSMLEANIRAWVDERQAG